MQNVETTVGEDNLLTMGAGVLDGQQQLIRAQHAALGTRLALDRPAQFRCTDRGGTQLADHDTGGQVGQGDGLGQFLAGSQGGCPLLLLRRNPHTCAATTASAT
ncbi:hypothetical protein FQZ97_1087420 [compost metagenome]